MRQIPGQLLTALRSSGTLPVEAGATVSGADEAALVELPQEQGAWDDARSSQLLGVRFSSAAQLSMWSTLPGDSMGSILDADDLAATLTHQLRLAGTINILPGNRFAVAAGLGGSLTRITQGKNTGVARHQASYRMGEDKPIRVLPDESVSSAAFDRGADEVGRHLAAALLDAFARRR